MRAQAGNRALHRGNRCPSCIWLNEKALEKMDGIEHARVNYATHQARIRWDPGRIGLEDILGRIESFGYRPLPWSASERSGRRREETRDLLYRFGTAGFFSIQLMIVSAALYAGYFQGMDGRTKLALQAICMLLTLPVLLYAGRPFLSNGLSGLGRLQFTMDSLVTLGAGSAFVYSIYSMLQTARSISIRRP
jgi:Cu2+-exporting ATPase